jgi:putative ABC transport system permease protein
MGLTEERRNQTGAVRITTAGALPEGLAVTGGNWWNAGAAAPQLAVSEDAQKDFHLRLGDRLVFQIAGRMVEAPLVATFRREARTPVRYDLVFPEHALSGLPVVYYGAVHALPDQIPEIEAALFDAFPTVTVMNLADVLTRIQDAVNQIAIAIRFVAAFAIAAGVIILASSVAATRYRRVREVAVLKTYGATRAKITAIYSAEFSVLGAVAGLIGAALANVFTTVIAHRFLEAEVRFNWISVVLGMVLSALLANVAGWLASARILTQKPLEVLRNE